MFFLYGKQIYYKTIINHETVAIRTMTNLAIFGAKSIALGIYHAIHTLYKEYPVSCFLVSSMRDNPPVLAGLPVRELRNFSEKDACILIATPEDTHVQIIELLKQYGFSRYLCMDSHRENVLMKQYYQKTDFFRPLQEDTVSLRVYAAKSHRDRPLVNTYPMPEWCISVQAGAALADMRIADLTDDMGENISWKNTNYCELTVLYWLWKNSLLQKYRADYYGLFHYRRILQFDGNDLRRLKERQIDVILPYPTLHEPDIREHHARYLKETDWEAMLCALRELQPEYAEAYTDILHQPYMYNYNMLIAKAEVLAAYCAWLFPVLERTEELSSPRGWERGDRYIGYLGENLLTLYFMYHRERLNIVHTGRIMLT